MMRVSIMKEPDIDDGLESTVYLEKDVETVEDMLHLLSEAFRAFGFTYIDRLEAHTEDGKVFKEKW